MTQLTYEGLIDEFFNIRHSCVKLPADKFLAPAEPGMDKFYETGLDDLNRKTETGRPKKKNCKTENIKFKKPDDWKII